MSTSDPRVDRTREHVLKCARELLLAEGAQAVTFSSLARQARVSRSTLYRHWADPGQLLLEVMLAHYVTQAGAESTQSVPSFLRAVRDNLSKPETVEALTALVAQAQRDPGTVQALQALAEARQENLATITGPLSDARFAAIVGPLFYQVLIARRPVDDGFLDELSSLVGGEA
jgi:AcrR family transcriptional regulator